MCKNRTPLTGVCLLASALVGCASEGRTNCAPVVGTYHLELEFVAAMDHTGEPGACNEVPVEMLNLSEDDLTINTGTSALNTRVKRFGCEVEVTYTQTVVNPGDPEDRRSAELRNNQGTKYAVEDRGVLQGETVYLRRDRDGAEICRALFLSTWLPEDVALEMMEQNP